MLQLILSLRPISQRSPGHNDSSVVLLTDTSLDASVIQCNKDKVETCKENFLKSSEPMSQLLENIQKKKKEAKACTHMCDTVLVFPCDHVTCTECWAAYAISRLGDIQYRLDPDLGYTLSFPLNCEASHVVQPAISN